MKYINTQTLQVQTENEIRTLNPNTSFPVPFVPPPLYSLVFPSPQPQYNPVTEVVLEVEPMLSSKGNYEQVFSVQPKYSTEEETQAAIQADLLAKSLAFQSSVLQQVQLRLDTFAQTRNYDSILSASTYATSVIPKFQAEGQAAVNARDTTWATLYTILGEVQAGTRPAPESYTDIEAELPLLEWPV